MFVGHALAAFALVAAAAAAAGVDSERSLAMGAAAAAFATVPDVDIAYAVVGLARVGVPGPWVAADAFWSTGNVVHREVTHSLVLGVPAAVGYALAATPRGRPAAVAVLSGVVAWVGLADGAVAALVAVAFALTGAAVAVVVGNRLDLSPRATFVAAAVGLLSHPWGDLFTGEPPAMLYPLAPGPFEVLVLLHPDPTLHLLAAFALELATVWAAAAVYCRLRGLALWSLVDRRAAVGLTYGVAAFVLPAPTLEVSYHFVFSVLAVGSVGAVARRPLAARRNRREAALTGLAAVTLAAGAYAVAYLATGAGPPPAAFPLVPS